MSIVQLPPTDASTMSAELLARIRRLDRHSDDQRMTPGRDPLRRSSEVYARIVWSRLTEPGDSVAGKLLETLGARLSLELLTEGSPTRSLRQHAAARGVQFGAELSKACSRWLPRLDRVGTSVDIDRALSAGLGVVLPGDPAWPVVLDDLGDSGPIMLWVRGDPRLLDAPSLSVVGARAVTGYGTHITAEIVEGVCAAGFTITSGAAYGVDAVAHRTALAVQAPTIAVLAGGADRAYPAAHGTLLSRIAETGVVCSEMVPGSAPTRWRFLQRNRIIAALSGTTLVTEAGVRSGTLNTAGHAASLGRSLGAVPGPVTSAASAGCHRLIREYGATLVTQTRDVLELMGGMDPLIGDLDSESDGREPSLHQRITDALPLRGGRTAAEIVRLAGVSTGEAHGALVELELLGRVRRRDSPTELESEWVLVRAQ